MALTKNPADVDRYKCGSCRIHHQEGLVALTVGTNSFSCSMVQAQAFSKVLIPFRNKMGSCCSSTASNSLTAYLSPFPAARCPL